MSPITTHVLDTARGQPAEGLTIVLDRQGPDGAWTELARGVTNRDGRVADLLAPGALHAGLHRVTFHTAAYFERLGVAGFYPRVEVVVDIRDPRQHYHIPLLLSPYGYSTYRGS